MALSGLAANICITFTHLVGSLQIGHYHLRLIGPAIRKQPRHWPDHLAHRGAIIDVVAGWFISWWIGSAITTIAMTILTINCDEGEINSAMLGKICQCQTRTRALTQYNDCLSRYRESHYKDRTVLRPSYLYNRNPYSCKTASLWWIRPQEKFSTRSHISWSPLVMVTSGYIWFVQVMAW